MSKTLDQFYPWIRPWVAGVPDPLLDQMILSSAIDFCARSEIVQRIITADATLNVQDYTITPPTDMQLVRILSVGWQGTDLALVSPDVVNSDVALRGAAVGTATPLTGQPLFAFQKQPLESSFSLYPIPTATVTLGLTIKAAFQPTNAALTVEDMLWDDWVEEIAAGAIARLMAMPGQTFSSSKSEDYEKTFEKAIVAARRSKNKGLLNSAMRVMPRRFAI